MKKRINPAHLCRLSLAGLLALSLTTAAHADRPNPGLLERMERFARNHAIAIDVSDFEVVREDDVTLAVAAIRREVPSASELLRGADVAVAYIDAVSPELRKGFHVVRVFARDNVGAMFLTGPGCSQLMLAADFTIGDPGRTQGCGSSAACGDITAHDDGTQTRPCCVAVVCSNGFGWTGCFTATVGPIGGD